MSKKAPTIGVVSLGCPKALVDSERIITRLRSEGYQLSGSYEGADLVVVNTCGFLDSAKAESLEAIGEALKRERQGHRHRLPRQRGRPDPRDTPEGARSHRPASVRGGRMALAGPVDWAGVADTYFAMVAVPSKRLDGVEPRTTQYDYAINGSHESRFLTAVWVPISTDGSRTIVYTGPKDHFLLTDASNPVNQAVGRPTDLEGLIDYGWFSWMSRPLAVPILKAIKWLRQFTGSYGIAIILFTIVIYSLFFPLKWRSSKSMKKAQKLAPKMKELQEKIKGMKQNDPRLKELQVEQLRLMKEGNPLGGCLPLLIQMPFLFALYRAITISLDFRQATFLWLRTFPQAILITFWKS